MRLRREKGWTQDQLALTLGISKRTLSNWENGYWLPPFRQRVHVVLTLRDAPPEYVLEFADALGVSVDPTVAPLLQPYRDALDPPPAPPSVPPPAPVAPRVPVDPERLRAAMDAIVRDAADGMNVPANDLRAALSRAVSAGAEIGATLEELGQAVVVKGKPQAPAPQALT
jgi:transcriptional regulator with XRE-family HTH domain